MFIMKKWRYVCAAVICFLFIGLYIAGYKYGVGADNSNIRLKEDVDSDNPVLNDTVYNYYICEEDGYIVVYKKDRMTVYMDTGISVDSVHIQDADRLKTGIPVEDITTLYTYLESFTS